MSQQQYLAHHQAAMESEMRPANYQVSAQPQTYAVQTAQQKPGNQLFPLFLYLKVIIVSILLFQITS